MELRPGVMQATSGDRMGMKGRKPSSPSKTAIQRVSVGPRSRYMGVSGMNWKEVIVTDEVRDAIAEVMRET